MQIHGKEITTIVSDLDGTLLGQGQELDPEVFGLIRGLKERGVSFVAASGRQYKNMRRLFEPIVKENPFICENGSLIVKNDKTVYAGYMPGELYRELLQDMLGVPETETIVSSGGDLYTLSERKEFMEWLSRVLRVDVRAVDRYEEIDGEINKTSVWWPKGIPEREEKWFHEKYDGRLHVTDSGNGWLDFSMIGVNKGTALRRLAELEGFSLKETLCFGDSENDIPMFHQCAVSYAMATGREHVRAEADYICTDTVVETLRSFLEAK